MSIGKPTRIKLFGQTKNRIIAKFVKNEIEIERLIFLKIMPNQIKHAVFTEDSSIASIMCNVIKDTFKARVS